MATLPGNLNIRLSSAVKNFWEKRLEQELKQRRNGRHDQGTRSAVTGGAQMDGFIEIIKDLIVSAGVCESNIFYDTAIDLPGYYRPTKEWDLLAILPEGALVAIEAKSQVGPSFGNNFNNRIEEAMGSALDFWTAYREGVYKKSIQPWLGYVFLLEDCTRSRSPVKVNESHFEVLPEFKDASYADRYKIFCKKLILERQYSSAAFLMSSQEDGLKGVYTEPAPDIGFEQFARSLVAYVGAFVK